MANTIQIKRGTGSSEPSSLAEGELAINLDSGKLFYGSGSSVLSDFKVNTLTAETYVVSSSVTHMTTSFSSGSTAFGDSAGDTHTFTGDITASGAISASGTITANAFIGNITGNLTGEADTVATIAGLAPNTATTQATQGAITSLGTLTGLTVSGDVDADRYHADLGNSKGYGIGATTAKPILSINAAGEPLSLGAAHASYVAAGVNIYTTGSDATKGLFLDSVGNMTVSADISSSANVYAADYFDNGANINTIYAPVLGADDNYVTDAEKTVIGNTSNTNSGNETTATVNALNITEVGALDDGTIASGFGTINSGEITATSIKHSISGNNAGDYGPGAEILYGISAETTTAGVIYDLRGGVWTPIDANGVNTYQHLCAVAVGTNSSTDGMLIKGCVTLASAYTDATGEGEGVVVYASETAGEATLVAPSDSGDIVRILGYSLNVSSKKMFFNPDSTYVEIA